jgi:hypothetical protein
MFNLGLKKKGLIQCISGKKGLAGPAGVLGLLGLLACWPCWLAGLLACGPCWPPFFSFALLAAFCQLFLLHQDSHVSLLSFPFFSFALLWFLFVSFQHYLSFSSCSFYVQIFICTLKHNIKFRLNKINIMHIKKIIFIQRNEIKEMQ